MSPLRTGPAIHLVTRIAVDPIRSPTAMPDTTNPAAGSPAYCMNPAAASVVRAGSGIALSTRWSKRLA